MTKKQDNQLASLQKEELYKLIIETTNEGVWMIDRENVTCFANNKLAEILKREVSEIIGQSVFEFIPKENHSTFQQYIDECYAGKHNGFEFKLKTSGADQVWTHMNISPIIKGDKYQGLLAMVSDITTHKINIRHQEEEHRNYISLFEDSPVPIWDEDFSQIKKYIDNLKANGVTDIKGYFEKNVDAVKECAKLLIVNNVNQAALDLNEIDSKEYLLDNYTSLVDKRSATYAILQFEAIANNQLSCEFDAELRTFKGNKRHVHLKWTVVKGYEDTYEKVYLSTTDVTERIIAENNLLKSSNKEKELLLKEIHHRVKNNLQITTSLLKLQSNGIEDDEVRSLFELSLHRINSMALVHELLYQSKDFSQIDYGNYLKMLIHPLIESLKNENSSINLNIEIHDISLNINTSIPLGLLINEIITNSLKHGLSNLTNGEIYIFINRLEDQHYKLRIGDNGKGYSPDFDIENASTLGLQLISSLTEQLNGTLERDASKPGTHYILYFEELPTSKPTPVTS